MTGWNNYFAKWCKQACFSALKQHCLKQSCFWFKSIRIAQGYSSDRMTWYDLNDLWSVTLLTQATSAEGSKPPCVLQRALYITAIKASLLGFGIGRVSTLDPGSTFNGDSPLTFHPPQCHVIIYDSMIHDTSSSLIIYMYYGNVISWLYGWCWNWD